MATLLTPTSIPCDVISSNTLYHNSLTNSSTYLSNTPESSKLTEIFPKLRTSSIDANEVNTIKDSNNFVSTSSGRYKPSLKYIEKQSNNINITKNLIKVDKIKTMSNSDVKEKNTSCKTKKVDSKKAAAITSKKLTNVTKKTINNTSANNTSSGNTIKNVNPKMKTKTNIKITTTKVMNLQNLNSQNQTPRLQAGNVTRKIINIRNPKKTSTTRTTITKLKVPNAKDNSNSLSLSKLSLSSSYNSALTKKGFEYLDKCFMNYSYNPEFSKKYRVKEEVGRGGFGLVFVAERISDGVEVAVKFIIKEKVPVSAWIKDPDLGIIPRECYLLKHVNHPCIIKYLDCYSDRILLFSDRTSWITMVQGKYH